MEIDGFALKKESNHFNKLVHLQKEEEKEKG